MISSICIPRIESTITKEYVVKILSNLRLGTIKNFTEIPLRNDPNYKRIIIKILWNTNEPNVEVITRQLSMTGSIKLVHNMPWYWKIVTTHQ